MTSPAASVAPAFERHFGDPADIIVQAPGRVNLIGEHTDYNAGFVLPMAIDRGVWIALRPRTDTTIRLFSLDYDEEVRLDPEKLQQQGSGWQVYVEGIARELSLAGFRFRGWDGLMQGNVPIGAGLSSSAALELAVARACAWTGGWDWKPSEMAQLAQKAENEWVGVQCGIMDQMVVAAGRQGHALRIDCRSLDLLHVPLCPDVRVVVMDTGTRRELQESAYNARRQDCEEAAAQLDVAALRDVSVAEFESRGQRLDDRIRRRARHVILENQRVLDSADILRRAQPGWQAAFGELMNASHNSLRQDYEVSTPALDQIVAAAWAQPGCFGARMTGAGFGGCAVALVAAQSVADFMETVAKDYRQETGLEPAMYACLPSAGAHLVDVSGN